MKPVTVANSLSLDFNPTEDAGALVPDLVQLLPASGFTGRDGRGPFVFSAETLLTAFAEYGMPLPIDYEHQSLTAADKTDPTPAAGWINELVPLDDGTLWGRVEWTEQAREYIAAKEYRYLSPVFAANRQTGEIARMLGAGITNNPNLYLVSFNSRDDGGYTDETTQDGTALAMNQEQLTALLAALGLPEDTTPEALTAHVATLVTDLGTSLAETMIKADEVKTSAHTLATTQEELATVANSLTDAKAELETVANALEATKGELVAMTQRASDAEAALETLKVEQHKADIAAAIKAAVVAGKVTPAQAEHMHSWAAADFVGFKAFVESTDPVLGTAPATEGAPSTETTAHTLTAEQLAHCTKFGFDPVEFAANLVAIQNTNT